MKYFCIVLYIIVIFFLQVGILPNLKIFNVFPNLFLLISIGLTILIGWKKALLWTISLGLFLDFYSSYNILGISTIGMLLSSFLTQFLNQKYFKKENKLSIILIFTSAIIFYELILLFFFKISDTGYDFYLSKLIIRIIYSLILALPMFYIEKWYVDKIK